MQLRHSFGHRLCRVRIRLRRRGFQHGDSGACMHFEKMAVAPCALPESQNPTSSLLGPQSADVRALLHSSCRPRLGTPFRKPRAKSELILKHSFRFLSGRVCQPLLWNAVLFWSGNNPGKHLNIPPSLHQEASRIMAVAPLNVSLGNLMELFEQQLAYGRPNLNKWQGPIEEARGLCARLAFPI